MSYADAENEVLRDRLKNAKEAGRKIRDLMKQTRMNPAIRAEISKQLLWITSPRAAELERNYELQKQQQKK